MLGLTLPTGSIKFYLYKFSFTEIYLYLGTGKACAGQRSVKLLPKYPLKLLELSVVGNLGKTPPIGSINK